MLQIGAAVARSDAGERNGRQRAGTQIMLIDLNRAPRGALLLRQRVEDMPHLDGWRLIIITAQAMAHQPHRALALATGKAMRILDAINRDLNLLVSQMDP